MWLIRIEKRVEVRNGFLRYEPFSSTLITNLSRRILGAKTREDQDLGFGQFAREDHELGCGPAFGLGSQHLVCGPGFRLRTTDREGQDLASEPGFGFRTAGREDQHLGSGPAFGLGGQDLS